MNYATSSGKKTATAQIMAFPGGFCGVDLVPPTTGFANVVIYDSENNTTANKIILAEFHVDAGFTSINQEYTHPTVVNRGLYCVLTQTGASDAYYFVRYTAG